MHITYTPKEMLSWGVVLLDKLHYNLLDIDAWYVGKYRNGWCVAPIGQECHIFISEKADILIPSPRNNLYKGDVFYEDGKIIYVFYDLLWHAVVRIAFISDTFE